MERRRSVANEFFLDASFAIALASRRDQYHARAVELSEHLQRDGSRLVTTRAVLLEIGNALAKRRFRVDSIVLLNSLEHDPSVSIVALTDDLYREASSLYQKHGDKEWGLTDCVSFVVMRNRQMTEALTADEHFRQAGFHPLLTGE
jgi:uncharacterized protein